jgi:hypothetical protein
MASRQSLCGLAIHAARAIVLIVAVASGATDALAAPKQCRGANRGSGCDNQAPTIGGTPSGMATVGQFYAFVPAASDPEGASLSFNIANKPPWAAFNASTGRLSGTPAASDAGVHVDISITVSDGKLTAALAPFAIEVGAANRAPTIGGTPTTAVREGQAYDFRPTAFDADGDALSFTIANRPSWATFYPQTGRLSGTPPSGSVGTYRDIIIRVTDGVLVATLPAYSITVQQVALGSATLSWSAPTLREDGSPLVNLAGYRIRYGNSPGNYSNQLAIGNPGITSCVIENLSPGTYYFVATAYDSAGVESGSSAVVSKTIS